MRLRPAALTLLVLLAVGPAVRANSSNSLMDVSPDGSLLLVANPDNGTVTVVDTVARKKLHEIKVGDKPEGVTWIGAGPLAAVAVYHDDRVVFLDAREGRVVKQLGVSDEPYGIVANQDGSRAWVTHEYPGSGCTSPSSTRACCTQSI
jgi:YVTN family beta-propeller protein